jgi:Holliday junction DNA helicase RuvA
MIGRLTGTLLAKHPPHLLVDAGGVGYEVEAPMSTCFALPATGERVTLHTHLVVRDDAHILYGFATETERRLFRALIKVNGVGPKLALTILSGISAEGFARCVRDNDAAQLTRLPGIGRKTAERLIVEMRDRLDGADDPAHPGYGVSVAATPVEEASAALLALGYKPVEAARLIKGAEAPGLSSEELIRRALAGALRG